jgi:hypothetical protein
MEIDKENLSDYQPSLEVTQPSRFSGRHFLNRSALVEAPDSLAEVVGGLRVFFKGLL